MFSLTTVDAILKQPYLDALRAPKGTYLAPTERGMIRPAPPVTTPEDDGISWPLVVIAANALSSYYPPTDCAS